MIINYFCLNNIKNIHKNHHQYDLNKISIESALQQERYTWTFNAYGLVFSMDEYNDLVNQTKTYAETIDPKTDTKIYFFNSSFPSLLLNRLQSNHPDLINLKKVKNMSKADYVITDINTENNLDLLYTLYDKTRKEYRHNIYICGYKDGEIKYLYGYAYRENENKLDPSSNVVQKLIDYNNSKSFETKIVCLSKSKANLEEIVQALENKTDLILTSNFIKPLNNLLPSLSNKDKKEILNMVSSTDEESKKLGISLLSYYNLTENLFTLYDVVRSCIDYPNVLINYYKYILHLSEYTYHSNMSKIDLIKRFKADNIFYDWSKDDEYTELLREDLMNRIRYHYEEELKTCKLAITFISL